MSAESDDIAQQEYLTDEVLHAMLREEELAALQELKQMDPEVCAPFSDRFLMRFVFGRKLDAKRALEMLRSHVEWRVRWRIDQVDGRAVHDYFEMHFTEWCPRAYDREGHGVQFFWPRNCDLNALVANRAQKKARKQERKQQKQARKQQKQARKQQKKADKKQQKKASKEGDQPSDHQPVMQLELEAGAQLEAHLVATQAAHDEANRHVGENALFRSAESADGAGELVLDLMTQFIWASYYVTDLALDHDLTLQKEGFVIVEDFAGASLMRNFRFPKEFDMKESFQGVQDNVPVRMRRIYVVNAPWYMTLLMKMMKPFAKSKLLGKVHLVSQEELHGLIAPENLPTSLGGTLQFDYVAFMQEHLRCTEGRLSEGTRQRVCRS
jgi:CRAL/TRIO domain